ncbi:MAG: sulfotransferase domain-containing protein [Planctomycetota bacterium]
MIRQLSRRKTAVFLLSTMRSGSTLLKSLLAAAPDVSHLPEHDFQRYSSHNSWRIKTLSDKPIILMKRPAGYEEQDYPIVPSYSPAKAIVLFRDAYETVVSLRKMNEVAYPEITSHWTPERLLTQYWLPVTESLWKYTQDHPGQHAWLRYEDLLTHPLENTMRLFSYIGSSQERGVDRYAPPDDYQWAWGNDDGGEKIKTNRVQPCILQRNDSELLSLIEEHEAIKSIRRVLGYG